MNTAVKASEILRRRVYGLHQIINLKSTQIVDEYHPLEEGLDIVKITKALAVLEIILSLKEPLDKNELVGYQKPLDRSEIKARKNFGRGRYNSYDQRRRGNSQNYNRRNRNYRQGGF